MDFLEGDSIEPPPGLMCTYLGERDDPMRHSPDDLPDDMVEAMTQSLLKEGSVVGNAFGLLPFCKNNPAPPVSYQPSKTLLSSWNTLL